MTKTTKPSPPSPRRSLDGGAGGRFPPRRQFLCPQTQQTPVHGRNLLYRRPPALIVVQELPCYRQHLLRQKDLLRLARLERHHQIVRRSMPPTLHAMTTRLAAPPVARDQTPAHNLGKGRKTRG